MASSDLVRLTNAEPSQSAFSLYSTPVDSTRGLSITFNLYAYGGTGGDGTAFIVLDGAAEQPRSAGGFGGSLGYANRDNAAGIKGGFFGAGFDSFGNYSNANEGRLGGSNLGGDSIAIRGAEAQGYQYVTGVGGLPSIDNNIDGTLTTSRETAKRPVRIDLTPDGLLSIKVDFNNDGDFLDAGETNAELQNVNIKAANGGVLPQTLRFGFAAASGSATNNHEVDGFVARTFDGTLLSGGFSDQIITGGTGNSTDKLTGGTGDDQIIGGGGKDVLTGGRGNDRFIFAGASRREAFSQSNLRTLDRINDFNSGEGDRILLDFDNQLSTPNLPRRLFNSGAESGSLRKAAKAAYADKDFTKRGNQKLKPNEAVIFTLGSKTYLSVNDEKASFSPTRDFLVDVTNIKLRSGDAGLGSLRVSNYFV